MNSDFEDAVKASGAIVAALGAGVVTPSEAAELGKLIDGYVRAITAADLDARLAKLEKAVPQ